MPSEALTRISIETMNLACAAGLRGGEVMDPAACLTTLDQWAERVRVETQRHFYRFRANPQEFENSEGYFRILMMSVVLYEDFGVRYNPERLARAGQGLTGDGFFADSRDVFLHGLLGPRRMGTCSSMPVLYVALGRRLGYPLKLVTTKGHLFARWESSTERFNIEVTNKGLSRFDDDYYKQWPFPVTQEEIEAEGYLKSLTPPEEMAVFLSIRGLCLMEAGRVREAAESYGQAACLAPGVRGFQLLQADAESRVRKKTEPHSVVRRETAALKVN